MGLSKLEGELRGLLLSREARFFPGIDEERQRLYRRLVRGNLIRAVERALPIMRILVGEPQMSRWLARWLEEAPPVARRLLDVPAAFTSWLERQDDLPHPACAELARWEAIELEVLNAPDADAHAEAGCEAADEPGAVARAGVLDRSDGAALRGASQGASGIEGSITEAATVRIDPSARLVSFAHPVHRLEKGASAWPDPAPVILLAHRIDEARKVVELSPLAAQILGLLSEGSPFGEVLLRLHAIHGSVDRDDASALLRDLRHRGAIAIRA